MDSKTKTEDKIVEVADWRKQNRRKIKTKPSRQRMLVSLVFGLACAIAWHFIHLAGENYEPSLADVHFWFHLAVEGVVALYAASICYIIWGLIQELRKKPTQ